MVLSNFKYTRVHVNYWSHYLGNTVGHIFGEKNISSMIFRGF